MVSKSSRFLTVFFTVVCCLCLFCACPSEPAPELGEFEVTLTLAPEAQRSTVIVSWTASENADGYSIERKTIRDGVEQSRIFYWDDTTRELSITDNTCEPDCTYTYIVTASLRYSIFIAWQNCYKQAPEKSITTNKDHKLTLDYPKNVKVEASEAAPRTLTVKWDAVENAALYEVYMIKDIDFDKDEKYKKIAQTTQTSYTIGHLTDESSYSFMVKAINGENYSLFSLKADETVPKAVNITMDKACMLTNGLEEGFYSQADSLWFKCTPQQGKIKFKGFNIYNNKTSSLSVFNSDGTVVLSGLGMFVNDEEENEQLTIIKDEDGSYEGVQIDLASLISSFVAGNTYYLRLSKENYHYFNINICVE